MFTTIITINVLQKVGRINIEINSKVKPLKYSTEKIAVTM